MADPTQDVPSDRPLGQRDGDFEFRAFRLGVTGAARVGAVVELADQLDRTIEGMDSAVPMVTDIHHAPAARALTVEDIKFPEGEIRILGPGIRHPDPPPSSGEVHRMWQHRKSLRPELCVF